MARLGGMHAPQISSLAVRTITFVLALASAQAASEASARGPSPTTLRHRAPGPSAARSTARWIDDEGPIRNSTPLPAHRSAEESLAQGDESWFKAATAEPRDRATPRNKAFDAWREALVSSAPGDGVRLELTDTAAAGSDPSGWSFPDPDSTHARRSEGVAEGVIRRLAALPAADRAEWQARFGSLARSSWERSRATGPRSSGGLSETYRSLAALERNYPFTEYAARAALALFDLDLEAGRPSAAGAWLTRAARHAQGRPDWRAAFENRSGALDAMLQEPGGQDHSQPPKDGPIAPERPPEDTELSTSTSGLPRLVTTQRLSGITRRSDEPFGLGLSTGIAFFTDGAAVVQGAHGILFLIPSEDGSNISLRLTGAVRSLYEQLFGIHQPVARAAPSAGGWPSLPASDGQHVAMVMGRGEPARSFRDVEIAAVGNTIGVCAQGPKDRPLQPLWALRDGLIALNPTGKTGPRNRSQSSFGALTDIFSESGVPLPSWDLGPGWEFQPGPVIADGAVFVLARGLGNSDENSEDRTDEVRLLALDSLTGSLRWSVSVTKERGLLDGNARGEAGYYAATTMPLMLERTSGTILVGTNSGLLAAYGAAEGRLLWAFRNQRRTVDEGGWPGSRSPILVETPDAELPTGPKGSTAWFTPFDSSYAYALPAGPAPLDGSLFHEAPRARGDALDLAAVLKTSSAPPAAEATSERSSLLLLGRYARYSALLIDPPGGRRQPAAYLAPGDRFGGMAALDASGRHLWAAGTAELSGFAAASDFSLTQTAPIASQGAGTGGDIVRRRDFLYVLGRDTVWVYALPPR